MKEGDGGFTVQLYDRVHEVFQADGRAGAELGLEIQEGFVTAGARYRADAERAVVAQDPYQ